MCENCINLFFHSGLFTQDGKGDEMTTATPLLVKNRGYSIVEKDTYKYIPGIMCQFMLCTWYYIPYMFKPCVYCIGHDTNKISFPVSFNCNRKLLLSSNVSDVSTFACFSLLVFFYNKFAG